MCVQGTGCGTLSPRTALTPLYVKTVVQAAKSAAWRARSRVTVRSKRSCYTYTTEALARAGEKSNLAYTN